MAAKSTTTCLKEKAPLLLTRICKLVAPYLLYAFVAFFHNAVKTLYVFPLTREMSRELTKMEHTDPSSAEYAGLSEETQHKAREVLVISIATAVVTLTLAFAKQIVACCFAASSMTCSSSGGDRNSFSGLLREATRWDNLKSSLVTTAAVVAVLQLVFIAVLGRDLVAMMIGGFELLSVLGFLFLAAFLAFLYLGVLTLTMVTGRRKEYTVFVLVTFLLSALLIPVCEVAVLYVYTEQVMGLGLSLLSVYDLLQGVQDLLYLSAAGVYFQWQ
jgi:hypothetical protein